MSQAENLLNSLTDEEIELYTTDPVTEEHIVIDENRNIFVPEALRRIGVQYDHNIETVTFDCPRYWDGHDMSKMNIYINYRRPDGQLGSYAAENVITENDIMHFTWTISQNVTEVKGNLIFLVCVKKVDEEGYEVNHWNSERCVDMYISEGLECTEPIVNLNMDIITQLLVRMDTIILSNNIALDKSLTESGLAADSASVGEAIADVAESIAVEKARIDNLVAINNTPTTNSEVPIVKTAYLHQSLVQSNYIPVTGDKLTIISVLSADNTPLNDYNLAFSTYDEIDGAATGGSSIPINGGGGLYIDFDISGAKYITFIITGQNSQVIRANVEFVTTSTAIRKELTDMRVGVDGTVYDSAGNAVRGQINDLHNELETMNDDISEKIDDVNESFNNYANAIKGSANGNIIQISDVSPVEHTVKCTVKSKNRFDGALLSGILSNDEFYFYEDTPGIFKSVKTYLEPGTYTISFGIPVNIVRNILDGIYTIVGYTNTTSHTFTVKTEGYVGFTFRDATSIETLWNDDTTIQIEKGEVATDYVDYVDPLSVSLTSSGKNLFPVTVGTANGVTLSKIADYYVLNGTATSSGLFITKIGYLPAGTYIVSANNPAHNSLQDSYSPLVQLYSSDTKSSIAAIDSRVNTTAYGPIVGGTNYESRIRYQEGVTYNNFIIKPQIELGTVATAYEPHVGFNTKRADNEGHVNLPSISPTMHILPNVENVIVECEYNVDNNSKSFILTDTITGIKYSLAVVNGKLTMMEVL